MFFHLKLISFLFEKIVTSKKFSEANFINSAKVQGEKQTIGFLLSKARAKVEGTCSERQAFAQENPSCRNNSDYSRDEN